MNWSFNHENHTYTVEGQPTASCTQVLNAGGLVPTFFTNSDLLERKSELGTEVHKACFLFNEKRAFTCDAQVRGYLNSWVEFCRRMNLVISRSECQQIGIVNGMPFGMQIDAEALIQHFSTVIEIKTGQIYPHHGIQLAGYAAGLDHARLETPLARFRSRKRIAVQLQENGTLAKIVRFEEKSDFDVFAASLFITYWKNRHAQIYCNS